MCKVNSRFVHTPQTHLEQNPKQDEQFLGELLDGEQDGAGEVPAQQITLLPFLSWRSMVL